MTEYALHRSAFSDLDEIRNFIAKESPDAADRVVDGIFDKIRDLAEFPYQGHARPDIARPHVRFVAVYEYLIAYAPDEQPLLIITVVHGRRNPSEISKILRQRS